MMDWGFEPKSLWILPITTYPKPTQATRIITIPMPTLMHDTNTSH